MKDTGWGFSLVQWQRVIRALRALALVVTSICTGVLFLFASDPRELG